MTRRPDGPGWVPPALPVPRRGGLRARLGLRTAALALVGLGLLSCLVPFALLGYGMWEEAQLTETWRQAVTGPSPPDETALAAPAAVPSQAPPGATPKPRAAAQPPAPQAAFAIRVPKIGYYAAVREGVSTAVLATGPGHYPTTSMPGRPGLVGIAAHNTFWIPFGQLGPGDLVVLETRGGRFSYRVSETRVVNPDDRTVLVQTSDPRLVLTTCWPLWAGNLAPQRLAIFAQLV